MRVPVYLTDQQIAFETLIHPPAYTAQRRARYLGVSGRQVVKSVLLKGPDDFFLAVLPATHQVDTQALAARHGGPVRLASGCEIATVFQDCEWGVLSPFGRLYGLRTVLEDELAPETLIVFEAHSHAEAIRMRCRDYERLENPRRLRFAQVQTASRCNRRGHHDPSSKSLKRRPR
jgi:Ala-tRNA(Pro) deacylase